MGFIMTLAYVHINNVYLAKDFAAVHPPPLKTFILDVVVQSRLKTQWNC